MTRRLPATLKKRLQTNLETLTPLEAGRLALVYYHESTGKKIGITDYPPAKELFAAFNARFDRAKGKPNERETVAAYNGFRFLVGLIETINTEAPGRLLESAFDAYQAQTLAGMILQQDAAGQVIAHLTRTLVTHPQPLQPELYDQVVAWLNGDRLVMLSEVAAGEVEGEEDDLNPWGDIPDDFKATHIENEDPADPDLVYLRAAEPIRKAWAEAQGDRRLDAFAGARSRLDAEPRYRAPSWHGARRWCRTCRGRPACRRWRWGARSSRPRRCAPRHRARACSSARARSWDGCPTCSWSR